MRGRGGLVRKKGREYGIHGTSQDPVSARKGYYDFPSLSTDPHNCSQLRVPSPPLRNAKNYKGYKREKD